LDPARRSSYGPLGYALRSSRLLKIATHASQYEQRG
jgi:hypothetical protein